MKLKLKAISSVLAFTCLLSPAAYSNPSDLSNWWKTNVDADGCVLQSALELKADKSCPDNQIVPDVRPMIKGTFNKNKSEAKQKSGKALCCFDWEIIGNR